jgi:hypothetical protein
VKRITKASPECETDRKDESEIAIGSGGWRGRQWSGTCEQGKRLGIEYRRAGTLDDPAVQHIIRISLSDEQINVRVLNVITAPAKERAGFAYYVYAVEA